MRCTTLSFPRSFQSTVERGFPRGDISPQHVSAGFSIQTVHLSWRNQSKYINVGRGRHLVYPNRAVELADGPVP